MFCDSSWHQTSFAVFGKRFDHRAQLRFGERIKLLDPNEGNVLIFCSVR